MPIYKYSVMGIFSNDGRVNPAVLDLATPSTIVGPPSSYGWTWRDTLAEAEQDFVDNDWASGEVWSRVSYPQPIDSVEVYLPDVQASFAQYPYTVTLYSYSFTAYTINPLQPPTLYYTTLVLASGVSEAIPDVDPPIPEPPPDPEDPPDITIQLKRDGTGTYSVKPGSESVLVKYANPVRQIRAKFASTRVAIIEDSVQGGFLVYEEVASVPSGNVYVYNSQRKLVEIVDAAYIAQYRAS